MRLSPSIALLRTQSDERLVTLAREGHEPAFAALVERYRRTVVRACRRVLSESRAEDAAQQVFLSAWRALGRGDDVRDARPWLLRIARNTALNALRNPGYDYDELAESLRGGTGADDEVERREVVRQTLAGLAALPDNQRDALLRSAVHGAAHADIARELGLTEGATRQLVLRARATLRSAATAVTPWPLVSWAASGSGAGVAEVAAGGSTAGATALLAKLGAVAVVAGGAAATPAIVDHGRDQPDSVRAAERQGQGNESGPSARSAPTRPARSADTVDEPVTEGPDPASHSTKAAGAKQSRGKRGSRPPAVFEEIGRRDHKRGSGAPQRDNARPEPLTAPEAVTHRDGAADDRQRGRGGGRRGGGNQRGRDRDKQRERDRGDDPSRGRGEERGRDRDRGDESHRGDERQRDPRPERPARVRPRPTTTPEPEPQEPGSHGADSDSQGSEGEDADAD